MPGWGNFIDGREVHTVPVADGRNHVLSFRCACQPKVTCYPGGGVLLSHFAFDGREITEFAVEHAARAVN